MKDAAAGLQAKAAEVAQQMTAQEQEQYGEEEEGEDEQEEMEVEVPVKKERKPKEQPGLKTIIENNTRVDT